tara:strand:- start:234 stop:377 length:144 start_codon:yes stop_codon:yes gene_type:complete
MILTSEGLSLVDDELQKNLKEWDGSSRDIVDLEGIPYDELFSKKSKD